MIIPSTGCELQEIRSKSKIGPEFRHSGTRRTEQNRWTVQQGFEFKWDGRAATRSIPRTRDAGCLWLER